jgi:hypothetical protein
VLVCTFAVLTVAVGEARADSIFSDPPTVIVSPGKAKDCGSRDIGKADTVTAGPDGFVCINLTSVANGTIIDDLFFDTTKQKADIGFASSEFVRAGKASTSTLSLVKDDKTGFPAGTEFHINFRSFAPGSDITIKVSTTPEPGSLFLLGAGLLGLLGASRRK